MRITKIVSGGQTGADIGGLDAAIHCDIPHGGWCPKGRRQEEDGVIPVRYQLTETRSRDWKPRTEANVVDSDATLIFTYGKPTGGSLLTVKLAKKHIRPCLCIDLNNARAAVIDAVVKWLRDDCPAECVLNVAGSRESKSPGIHSAVYVRMIDVISKVNGRLFYPMGEGCLPNDDAVPASQADPAILKEFARQVEARQPQQPAVDLFHPCTIDEAVDIVIEKLPEEAKETISECGTAEEILDHYLFMGMGIRNSLIHENRNRIDLMADFQRGCREGRWTGNTEPDNVSRVILEVVWERLQKER
jgi:hypothetical protein